MSCSPGAWCPYLHGISRKQNNKQLAYPSLVNRPWHCNRCPSRPVVLASNTFHNSNIHDTDWDRLLDVHERPSHTGFAGERLSPEAATVSNPISPTIAAKAEKMGLRTKRQPFLDECGSVENPKVGSRGSGMGSACISLAHKAVSIIRLDGIDNMMPAAFD